MINAVDSFQSMNTQPTTASNGKPYNILINTGEPTLSEECLKDGICSGGIKWHWDI